MGGKERWSQKMATLFLASGLLACLLPSSWASGIAVIQSSAAGDEWAPQPSLAWAADYPAPVDVTVDTGTLYQEMLGFGTAMTDTTAYNAMVFMNSSVRAEFLEALWGASGLHYSIGRVTLNSADYSFQSFNYDNVVGLQPAPHRLPCAGCAPH